MTQGQNTHLAGLTLSKTVAGVSSPVALVWIWCTPRRAAVVAYLLGRAAFTIILPIQSCLKQSAKVTQLPSNFMK